MLDKTHAVCISLLACQQEGGRQRRETARDRKGQENKEEERQGKRKREREAAVVLLLPPCLSLPRASYHILLEISITGSCHIFLMHGCVQQHTRRKESLWDFCEALQNERLRAHSSRDSGAITAVLKPRIATNISWPQAERSRLCFCSCSRLFHKQQL